jgi:hypothetical protein
VKIIKQGTNPDEVEWRFTCRCGTVFECPQREVTTHHDWRDGDYVTYNCPVCERQCYGIPK